MRYAWAILGGLAGFLGLGALAHTPVGRPLLRALAGGSCPVGMDQVAAPEVRDAARSATLPELRGPELAASRPALGFALDTSTRAELMAWAASAGVSCSSVGAAIQCAPLPAGAVPEQPAATSISFQLDGQDRLVAVSTRQDEVPAEAAVALVEGLSHSIETAAGPVTKSHGKAEPAWLAGGDLNQLSREFRFQDYRASVTATNLGHGRIAVRALYQSLVTGAPTGT